MPPLSLSVSLSAVENRSCTKCAEALNDSVNICKIGYGLSRNKLEAAAMAKIEARDALLDELRDSVALICRQVDVMRDDEGEFLSIKYFNKNETPTKYYFHADNILKNVTILCEECTRNEMREYHACCVLCAPRDDFSRASNIVMFQILGMMSETNSFEWLYR